MANGQSPSGRLSGVTGVHVLLSVDGRYRTPLEISLGDVAITELSKTGAKSS